MSKTDEHFEMPTNPEDLKRIKNAIGEIVGHERLKADQQELIKDAKTMLKETFEMPPALTAKLVKAFHDDDYQEILGANSTFEYAREAILGDGIQEVTEDEPDELDDLDDAEAA
jgi:hypothetical protein